MDRSHWTAGLQQPEVRKPGVQDAGLCFRQPVAEKRKIFGSGFVRNQFINMPPKEFWGNGSQWVTV